MTTYTEDEIALARRGAKWCAFNGSTLRRAAKYDDMLLTQMSGALFVALLDKCKASKIGVRISEAGQRVVAVTVDELDDMSGCESLNMHKNRTLALLLALDAAGLLPEEDA